MGYPPDSLLQQLHVEVDQQAEPIVRDTQIGQHLRHVHIIEGIDRFQFQDHFALNPNIQFEAVL